MKASIPRHKMERLLGEQIFSRVAGTRMVGGNSIRLLRDAAENYPAWLAAIEAARHHIDFENYIVTADATGERFAAALTARAAAGVQVRLLYDWLGCLTKAGPGFWRRLRQGGVEVRCFNPPGASNPFDWLNRNHRKTLSVDGRIGFVSGLCVGGVWQGDPARDIPPWRDTGIELRGPVVSDVEAAFERSWRLAGPAGAVSPPADLPAPEAEAGEVTMSVIPSQPGTMGVYRLDQLIAAVARRSLWLTDAYFVGTTAYVRALCDAARDGVDVRLLVPGSSDLPGLRALSQAGYRPLLEAGIRVFEWDGSMLHAKTAVADTSWARIGSSNLNLASWIGNWELDIAVEDAGFARQMEAMFLDDLENATEIVLELGKVHRATARDGNRAAARDVNRAVAAAGGLHRGGVGRLTAGVVGLGSTVGAMISKQRALGPAEARIMAMTGCLLLLAAAVAVLLPRLVTVPLAVLGIWIGAGLLARAWQLHAVRRR